MKNHNLGYPRIGEKRELKKATERYWKKEISASELEESGKTIREKNWKTQKDAGIELIPVNDFSFYDQMLDMSLMLGVIPERFREHRETAELDLRFLIARGGETPQEVAGEMTKWFDTNYHYIVPELDGNSSFIAKPTKLLAELEEAKNLGINAKPVIIGPVTFLRLAKYYRQENSISARLQLLPELLKGYESILKSIAAQNVEWIQIDEPVLSLDLCNEEKQALATAYSYLKASAGNTKIILANYFGTLDDNLATAVELPINALHVDLVRGETELPAILDAVEPKSLLLSLGVVDGRNVWKNDFVHSLDIIKTAADRLGHERLMIAPSCSLIHSPVTLRNEAKMSADIKSWMSFAEEKLSEVALLAKVATDTASHQSAIDENVNVMDSRKNHPDVHNQEIETRYKNINPKDYDRAATFAERIKEQQEHLKLPVFPTTTIGSFPQTKEIRKARADFKKAAIDEKSYDDFMKKEIQSVVKIQEDLDLDVLVHGEPERNDMVEYFGEQMSGYVFSQNGWVQSYGSRYVKPPIIYGSVGRPNPMTVYWSSYAKSLTTRPMKGMLSGPITMLQWSFVRNDQSRDKTAFEIALALRDEVVDLEKNGISVIQVDEPAIREGLPLRRKNWSSYLKWSVDAFKLSTAGVKNSTQIHTHMCYSDFNDIIDSIAALDADVISIETSRSQMELLQCFKDFKYPNEIGPGVYDIHSPRVPTTEEMKDLLDKASKVIDPSKLWVNPDCGLKTRQWAEVTPALEHMVAAAKALRK